MSPKKRGRAVPGLPEIGAVYAVRVPDGRFGACQVIGHPSETQVELATLDGLWAEPPSVEDVRGVRVLKREWGSWRGDEDRVISEGRVPWWAEHVGTLPVVEVSAKPCASYGGWSGMGAF